MSNIENPQTDTKVFGLDLKTPIMMAPTAAQGLAHAKGEIDTAKGVAAAGGLMAQSTYSSTSIADTAAAGEGAPQFFQLYMSKDWTFNESLLDEAKNAGVKAIILTVDATVDGYREADIINNFQFPIPMANLTKFSEGDGKGKGISEIYAAAAGVYVSNHGGRQLNGGPASFDVLADVAKAVNHQVPVIFDSGVRRGSDVFKAIASGADLVAMGRPVIYGLALGGAKGVESVFNHLNDELKIIMQLAGTKTVADIKNAKLLNIKY
ncbi:L-lactate oxidase [Paucilactobacillus suebicus DSM 5007 = KCTC 3549]|uniref:L-lactate oxidase n=1 Tax=Paucilactobacillus suebicus DSM 5007 = KCTC 3549 TaxID=1423807 RepID=A0A0R1W287_9LACO|nr:L-lactate oxidase [Paucilactobacillus suebicus DSM 5007 = KCTC 3549]